MDKLTYFVFFYSIMAMTSFNCSDGEELTNPTHCLKISNGTLPLVREDDQMAKNITYLNNTVDWCIVRCKNFQYRFVGLQGTLCACGIRIRKGAFISKNCNLGCPGNQAQICGGENSVSIYKSGFVNAASANTRAAIKTTARVSTEGGTNSSQSEISTQSITMESSSNKTGFSTVTIGTSVNEITSQTATLHEAKSTENPKEITERGITTHSQNQRETKWLNEVSLYSKKQPATIAGSTTSGSASANTRAAIKTTARVSTEGGSNSSQSEISTQSMTMESSSNKTGFSTVTIGTSVNEITSQTATLHGAKSTENPKEITERGITTHSQNQRETKWLNEVSSYSKKQLATIAGSTTSGSENDGDGQQRIGVVYISVSIVVVVVVVVILLITSVYFIRRRRKMNRNQNNGTESKDDQSTAKSIKRPNGSSDQSNVESGLGATNNLQALGNPETIAEAEYSTVEMSRDIKGNACAGDTEYDTVNRFQNTPKQTETVYSSLALTNAVQNPVSGENTYSHLSTFQLKGKSQPFKDITDQEYSTFQSSQARNKMHACTAGNERLEPVYDTTVNESMHAVGDALGDYAHLDTIELQGN